MSRVLVTGGAGTIGAAVVRRLLRDAQWEVRVSDQRAALTEGARALIGRWRGPGTLLVVTHGANIQALTGHCPSPGEMVAVVGRDEAGGTLDA